MGHELSVCWLPLEEMLREGEVMDEVPLDVEDEDPYKTMPCNPWPPATLPLPDHRNRGSTRGRPAGMTAGRPLARGWLIPQPSGHSSCAAASQTEEQQCPHPHPPLMTMMESRILPSGCSRALLDSSSWIWFCWCFVRLQGYTYACPLY